MQKQDSKRNERSPSPNNQNIVDARKEETKDTLLDAEEADGKTEAKGDSHKGGKSVAKKQKAQPELPTKTVNSKGKKQPQPVSKPAKPAETPDAREKTKSPVRLIGEADKDYSKLKIGIEKLQTSKGKEKNVK